MRPFAGHTFLRLAAQLAVGLLYLALEPNLVLQASAVLLLALFLSQPAMPRTAALSLAFSLYLVAAVVLYADQQTLDHTPFLLGGTAAAAVLIGTAPLSPRLTPARYLAALLFFALLLIPLGRLFVQPALPAGVAGLATGLALETPLYDSFPAWKTVVGYGSISLVFCAAIAIILYLFHA